MASVNGPLKPTPPSSYASTLRLSESRSTSPQTEPRPSETKEETTVLYLAYGSNLSAETFRGKRGIQPLSQVNVVVPELCMNFNLPGIPYSEPCFANTEYRESTTILAPEQKPKVSSSVADADHHDDKIHWTKGLVGVVYEVTKTDYAHIIATEGGGSGYQDVVVDCYALSRNPNDQVPCYRYATATTAATTAAVTPFKAHTLLASESQQLPGRQHSYAQPSERYLKLIQAGAAEHALPHEYQAYLAQIHPFRITTTRQRIGRFLFLAIWSPVFAFLFFGFAEIFANPDDGTYPEWFARLQNGTISTCWACYDWLFRPVFGEGERTIGDDVPGEEESRKRRQLVDIGKNS
ncbi:hypothetical protein DV738_g4035, partial [Chaetothyriales sp. CBS 135597]